MLLHRGIGSSGLRPAQVVFVDKVQFGQVLLHGTGRHEREPGVDAVLREVFGKRAQEKSTKHASEAGTIGIPLAIVEAPGGQVIRCIVLGEEPVPSGEGDSITQDGTTNGVS